ncbi:hydrolase [Streptantibioticus ferralitis]|uniref:Hydrolase n=1 Tax=Streptantibioticus ferralitis TaxID=236510 RepID=A0ABT5YY68_9ACTN|nr:hydrolase [Streptantibioticus ferralitis]MDF2256510.1 hydrolase [Streptantibioticus ferralitis]
MPELTSPESGIARAAHDVATLAAHHAERAEEERQLSPEVLDAIMAAGFGRHFVGSQYGGADGTFAALSAAVAVIGAKCPAAAWCASLAASMARMVGYLPEEGRKQVWQDGPDVLVVGGVSPIGRAHAERDGWLLSGTWPYISAVAHSDWALVCGVAKSGTGYEPRLFAIPRADYRVKRTWSDVGMRATGSDTLIAEDVYVPASLSFPLAELLEGTASSSAPRCHSVPLTTVNGLFFTLPILGAAEGTLDLWSSYAEQKIRTWSAKQPGPARGFYEETLARTSGTVDAARLLLERAARVADRGTEATPLERARNQRDCILAADLLVTAVNQLFRASGTTGHSVYHPLQRLWRDANSAAGHVVLQPGPGAAAYTTSALGLDG